MQNKMSSDDNTPTIIISSLEESCYIKHQTSF